VLALVGMARPCADWMAHRIRPRQGDLRTLRLLPPSAGHWLGTDDQGRDILSRIIYGSRITLFVVALVAVLAAPVGLLVGTVAGYAGGWVDAVLMRITDIFLAFPEADPGAGLRRRAGAGHRERRHRHRHHLLAALCAHCARRDADGAPGRLHRAVRLMGASPVRIVLRHIMPLCLPIVIVRVTLDMAGIILTAAGLGFLGLGAQPPLPEWGAMISSGRASSCSTSGGWRPCPGLAIFIVSLASTCWATACATRSTRDGATPPPEGAAPADRQ
jgi:peptide/nickel transport system permease protein